jgi:dihydropyrimidine dehydrogenase (NAD+) subunit PreA
MIIGEEKMTSMEVKIKDIVFENPFILASAPPTARIEGIEKAFSLGWAGAVLKTIPPDSMEIHDVSPRFHVLKSATKDVIGFENMELLSRKSQQYWKDGISVLKKKFPSKVIIASIMAQTDKQSWQNLVFDLEQSPLDAFELNFSCPNGLPEKKMGMAIGTDAELSATITKWVKEVAKAPVFVKLSPNVTDIKEIAEVVAASGADGISVINTVQCLIGVDLDTLSPLPDVGGHSTFGGYSGRSVKPIGLRCAAQAGEASNLPILGMGGISSWEDAVEYIAIGADAVQICTEVMLNGYGVIKKMLDGLENYLNSKNLSSLCAIKGKALQKLASHESLERNHIKTPVIDESLCAGCHKCVMICDESGYQAIELTSFGVHPVVNKEKCDGCGLCGCVCPRGAIN